MATKAETNIAPQASSSNINPKYNVLQPPIF